MSPPPSKNQGGIICPAAVNQEECVTRVRTTPSIGDRQMLEYTTAGAGVRLGMLVLHDDSSREYAYGPARGLPDTRVGTFSQALDDEAKKNGWTVISMKNDWKHVFTFEV
jgi:hypothetical protein